MSCLPPGHLHWQGGADTRKELRIAVKNCYGSVALQTVFVSRQMLPVSRKDVLPAIQRSSVIYEYKCHCDSRYEVEQLSDFKTASSSMFRNGYDCTQPPSECNLTERASVNNPFQNVTRQLDNAFLKTTNVLPITTMINSLFWTLHAALSILVCSKQATLKYGDLIYANRKSLSILLNCSSRI